MKKVYLIFSLLLMFLGINTAYAGVTLGDVITDPSTLKAGDKIVIRTDSYADESAGTHKFISSLLDEAVFATTTDEQLDPYVTFTLEDAGGKTIHGEKAFYLKNDYNQKYITYVFVDAPESEGGSVLDDGSLEMRLEFTSDATKATPIVIKTQKVGGEWFAYKGDAPTRENCMMILSECTEVSNSLIGFNCNFSSPYIANYSDWAAWWQIYTANISNDYVKDLESLYSKVLNLTFVGGTAPGCYDEKTVEEFNAARTEAGNLLNGGGNPTSDDAKPVYDRLETAYLALITGTPVAIHEGYYRIINAFPNFASKQDGAQMTINATNDGHLNWKKLDESDATMVWQFIDRKDGTWLMYNIGTGQYVNGTNGSAVGSPWYSLGNDSTNHAIKFTSLGQSQFNIAISGVNSMHAGNHNDGAGTNGFVVAWNGGLNGASAWYIKDVDESLIPGFQEIGDQNKLNRELETLYDEASAKYANGSSYTIDTDTKNMLVTKADFEADEKVIVSNQDQNTLGTSTDGAGYIALVDEDTTTHWHSYYGDGHLTQGGYLQFKLNKAVDAFAVYYSNRKNQINTATQLDFYVSNDTTDENSWVKAGSITNRPSSTDASGNGLNYQSEVFASYQNYQYVRVYWTAQYGYTHFTEFHIEPATLSPECQNATLGDVADNLAKELNSAGLLISSGKATRDAINSLKAAYEAYSAALADPTALINKMDSIQGVYDKAASPNMLSIDGKKVFDEGQPGVYTNEAKAALKVVLDEVQSYLDAHEVSGDYTKTDLQTNMDKLNTAFTTFKSSVATLNVANDSKEGNWYYLSYSQHYFDVTGKTQDTYTPQGATEPTGYRKGTVYVNADVLNDNLNDAQISVTGNKELKDVVSNVDLAKWRFVNMGDTAYAIQNKATGLYIGKKTTGNAGLSMTPVGFKITEIGYATFILDGTQLNGEKTSPIHVQTNGQVVVFWNNYDLGGGSCFDIEDTKEPANSDETIEFKVENVVKGRLYTKCYPISLQYMADEVNKGAYPYQIATIDTINKKMTLTEVQTDLIEAGTPFFYIAGGKELNASENPTKSDTIALLTSLYIDKKFAQTPKTENGLVGNYYPTNVVAGFGVIKYENGVQSIASTTTNQQIGWNSAYIDLSLVTNSETPGEITVPLTGDLQTSIKDAIIDAQIGNVNVYSIDGILIKKNVKPSEATKGLAKGIYIVGKQKIAVK